MTLEGRIAELEAENELLTRERDLAVAHDRQPYPTAFAYDQACKVMHEAKARVAELEAENERLRGQVRARAAATAVGAELRPDTVEIRRRMQGIAEAFTTPGDALVHDVLRLLDWVENVRIELPQSELEDRFRWYVDRYLPERDEHAQNETVAALVGLAMSGPTAEVVLPPSLESEK